MNIMAHVNNKNWKFFREYHNQNVQLQLFLKSKEFKFKVESSSKIYISVKLSMHE